MPSAAPASSRAGDGAILAWFGVHGDPHCPEDVLLVTSRDEGRTWSRGTRISVCSGNVAMTEVADGRVLVVFHEGYRRPTRVRAQFLRVRRDGIVEPG